MLECRCYLQFGSGGFLISPIICEPSPLVGVTIHRDHHYHPLVEGKKALLEVLVPPQAYQELPAKQTTKQPNKPLQQ